MISAEHPPPRSPAHRQALRHAFDLIEKSDFAGRLANYAGQPINRLARLMPQAASDRLSSVVEIAILNCLKLAISSIKPRSKQRPATRASTILAGLSGGVSGFFGVAALPIELPMTTTLMLRAIADIARHHGEDLSSLEARLACIEVFALGAPKTGRRIDVGYFASRALLSRLTGDASAVLLERGLANVSAPVVTGFIAEIATRYGVVVSERVAASALPVLGALGGATVNVIFINHFQRIAQGHFTIRRLEREYGAATVRRLYEELAPRRLAAGA
jgi:hypothetical protein